MGWILRARFPLLVLVVGSLTARSALAQGESNLRNTSLLGVGYVASIPNTYVGFSVIGLSDKIFGGAGLYADFKTTTGDRRNDPYFFPGVSVDSASLGLGDMPFDEKSEWLAFNLALVYAVTYDFAVYGGAGYARERHYQEFYDDSQERGDYGFYWVADPAASGNRVNVLGGVLFRLAKLVMFQFGAESQPAGVTLGMVFAFPL